MQARSYESTAPGTVGARIPSGCERFAYTPSVWILVFLDACPRLALTCQMGFTRCQLTPKFFQQRSIQICLV